MNSLTIFKFGGTSVGSAEAIRTIPDILKSSIVENKLIVVSAQSGITNLLIDLARGKNTLDAIKARLESLCFDLSIAMPTDVVLLLKNLKVEKDIELPINQKEDAIASYGERFSIYIISAYLASCNINSITVDAREIIVTDSNFGNANYDESKTIFNANKYIAPLFEKKLIPIVTGFIAQDANGQTTTLGRGGSDLTATILAAALHANLVEIWTDVDGIMSADPNKIPSAQVLPTFSYEETFELSNWGARVMYNNSLKPAYLANIPIQVKNTFNPKAKGTLISNQKEAQGLSITTKGDVSVLTIYNPSMVGTSGYLGEFFAVFKKLGISVDIIAVSEASVSLTTSSLDSSTIKMLTENVLPFGTLKISQNCSIVAIISNRLSNDQKIIADATRLLTNADIKIEMISFGNSEINISFVVPSRDEMKSLALLHNHFVHKIDK